MIAQNQIQVSSLRHEEQRCAIKLPLQALAFSMLGPTLLSSPLNGHPVSATTISTFLNPKEFSAE
jgi:hypothetical protein